MVSKKYPGEIKLNQKCVQKKLILYAKYAFVQLS